MGPLFGPNLVICDAVYFFRCWIKVLWVLCKIFDFNLHIGPHRAWEFVDRISVWLWLPTPWFFSTLDSQNSIPIKISTTPDSRDFTSFGTQKESSIRVSKLGVWNWSDFTFTDSDSRLFWGRTQFYVSLNSTFLPSPPPPLITLPSR